MWWAAEFRTSGLQALGQLIGSRVWGLGVWGFGVWGLGFGV